MTEAELQDLEERIPHLADAAFAEARRETLAHGLSVLEADAGFLYEVFPDGTRNLLKPLPKPSKVAAGTVLHLK